MRLTAVLTGFFLQVSGWLILSTQLKSIISYCAVLINHLSKEILKSYTIIFAENKTDTRIHGTIYASHKKGKKGKVLEATLRPYVQYKEPEKPVDRVGQQAHYKP